MSDAVLESIALLASDKRPNTSVVSKAFEEILGGQTDEALIAAFLMGLRVRGELVEDIIAGARVMRANAKIVQAPEGAVDTCGTGGLPWVSLNTSTAAAIVAASAGAIIAKHGNRSTPPKTGSADVLEALGVNLTASDDQAAASFRDARLHFMFAQAHHGAMRHVGPVRRKLGIRTIFNLLGPLSNPAGARRQVLGVFAKEWVEPYASALSELGVDRAWVVHGVDGIDELSISGSSVIADVSGDNIRIFEVDPGDLGLPMAKLESLRGGDAESNAKAITDVLEGRPGPFADLVCLNAAASLVVGDIAEDLQDGLELCRGAISDGRAHETLKTLVRTSNG